MATIALVVTNVWCSESPTFASVDFAGICQRFAMSSVECLPSATVAENFFLNENAYHLGIYTLILLGGENLVPLASAAIMQSFG